MNDDFNLFKRVFDVLRKFRLSAEATKQLYKETKLSILMPPQTRWSYLAIAYKRVLQVISSVRSICKSHKWSTISVEDENLMKEIVGVVEPFQKFTLVLQSESRPTLSLVYGGIMMLIDTLVTE